jgi:hypothetical protein
MSKPAGDAIRKRKRKLRVLRPFLSSGNEPFGINKTLEIDQSEEVDNSSLNEKDNKRLLELRANWIKKLTTEEEMASADFTLDTAQSDGSVSALIRKGSTSRKATGALVELLQRENSPPLELPEELQSIYMEMVSEIQSLFDRQCDELKRMLEYHIQKILIEVQGESRQTTDDNESDE